MSLGSIIRCRRKDLDLTQDQVAARADISKPYLSNIETGRVRNPPSDSVLQMLEKALSFGRGELTRLAHLERTPVDIREEHERLSGQVKELRHLVERVLDGQDPSDNGAVDKRVGAFKIISQSGCSQVCCSIALLHQFSCQGKRIDEIFKISFKIDVAVTNSTRS